MAKPWRIAKSLLMLRKQIDNLYPDRDKTSDGAIGDAAHATRASDHNPWVKDNTGQPIVTAIDIDEDLNAPFKTLQGIIDAICASRDGRVKYIIYEGRITVKGSRLQAWKKYVGKNAHKHHAHISVESSQVLYDSEQPWNITASGIVPIVVPASFSLYTVQKGDTLWGLARKFATSVEAIQTLNGLRTDVLQINQTLRVR